MDIKTILPIIFEVVIIPLLAALTGIAVKWLNSKANQIKEKTKNETLNKYVDMLNEIISTTVIAVNQTYVDTLKEENSFDKDAQEKALNKVFTVVRDSLTEDAIICLNEAIGDLDTYILNKIEQEVKANK